MKNDLPCGPGTPGYVGEDEIDRAAGSEALNMRRAFNGSRGISVVDTVYKVAGVGKANAKGQTEKPVIDHRAKRKEARRAMIRRIRENGEGE